MTIVDKILKLEEFLQSEIAELYNIDARREYIRRFETALVNLRRDVRPEVVEQHRSVRHLLADSERKTHLLLEFEHVVAKLATTNQILRKRQQEFQAHDQAQLETIRQLRAGYQFPPWGAA